MSQTIPFMKSSMPSRKDSARVIVCIVTLNEEKLIAGAIRSAKQLTNDIVVVDSFSSDATCEIASREGAIVWQHEFESYARQRNWALDRIELEFGHVWMMDIDADERVSPELGNEIRELMLETSPRHDVYIVKWLLHFHGRPLRHGGFASTKIARLYDISAARYEIREINQHLAPLPGTTTGSLKGRLIHEDVRSWTHHIDKHNMISSLEAAARLRVKTEGRRVTLMDAVKKPFLRRRWLREAVWDRLPGRPAIRFVQIYFLLGGFLDGSQGFEMAVFQAWQEMCIDLKYQELLRERAADNV